MRLAPIDAIIRPARPEDADFLVSLSERVFSAYSQNARGTMLYMMRKRTSTIAVAVSEEVRVGFVVVNVEPLGRDFGPLVRPSVAHLDAIAVRPSVSGRGVGRRLLAHAETFACGAGAVSMSLLTAESNTHARRLFRAAGYQMLAPFEDVYVDEQRGISMFKTL